VKYHPNVISSKGYCDNRYLFIPTGLTFGDTPSPPSFEPFAGARMALATDLNFQAKDLIPQYDNYLSAVQFAPPPDAMVRFIPACPDSFNRGVLDDNGIQEPTEYNMHVDYSICCMQLGGTNATLSFWPKPRGCWVL
jgi:hypothetical protein